MRKKKTKVNDIDKMTDKEIANLQDSYILELTQNPEFSLEVDPTNKYNLPEEQKEFIKNYVQFKSVGTAAELSGIDVDLAKQYFIAYPTQMEIRRINRALYHRQFHEKMLDLDAIGGYLSSLITDEHVPLAGQLKPTEKLKAVDMLIDLNKMKREALENPENVMQKDIGIELKDLSVSTIQKLLTESKKSNNKKENIINDSNLTPEEKEYLNTLPTEELLQLIEETNKGGQDDE